MSFLDQTTVLTTALQLAIVAFRNGKTLDEAKKEVRGKLWESYTPESQAAAERGIESYYSRQAGKAVVAPVVTGPILIGEEKLTLSEAMESLPTNHTKDALIELAKEFNIKVTKSWTKAKITETLVNASPIKSAA